MSDDKHLKGLLTHTKNYLSYEKHILLKISIKWQCLPNVQLFYIQFKELNSVYIEYLNITKL